MAALKDIATAAGVSVGTVSRILNQGRAHLYKESTRERVLAASRQFGYRPNRFAQGMRLRKTNVIGFASMNIDDEGKLQNHPVYPFVVGLNRHLVQEHYHVAFVECSDLVNPAQPEKPWELQEQFLDGLVVHYGLTDRASRFAINMGVPLIWWDSGIFAPYDCIYRDEITVGRELTRRLIEMGHRRIGFLAGQRGWETYCAGKPAHYSYAQRFESYRDELRSHGLREVPLIGEDPVSIARQLRENKLTAVLQQGMGMTVILSAAAQLG